LVTSPTVKDRTPSGTCTTCVAFIAMLLLLLLLLLDVVMVVVVRPVAIRFGDNVSEGDVVFEKFLFFVLTSEADLQGVVGLPLEHNGANVVPG
jgi:hypothetical protein